MELIYVWLGNIGRGIYDEEMNLSDNYEVAYDKISRKLSIIKKDSDSISYGTNIINVNLLVGRNGSGKSSVMSLLGLSTVARSHEFQLNPDGKGSDKAWIMVYHLKGNRFLIEGFNNKIMAIIEKADYLKPQYSIICEYDFSKDCIKSFSPARQDEFDGWYMFYDSSNSRSWFEKATSQSIYGQDLLMYRHYLNKASFSDVFNYLREAMDKKSLANGMEINPAETFLNIGFNNEVNDYKLAKTELDQCSLKIYGKKDMFWHTPLIVAFMGKPCPSVEEFRRSLVISYLEGVLNRAKKNGDLPKKPYEKAQDPENEYAARKEFLLSEAEIIMKNQGYNSVIDRKICDALEKIDAKFFVNAEHNIKIPLNDLKATSVKEFLKVVDIYIDYINNPLSDFGEVENAFSHTRFFRVRYGQISAGEMEIINFYASLHKGIAYLKDTSLKEKTKTLILLLDEPDNSFHPEWSRLFIDSLSKTLSDKMFSKYRYQVIIGTHSPIMLSDVAKDHIFCFSRNKDRLNIRRAKTGFMSNIHDIMKESFFINFPVGEFARNYVDKLLKRINIMENKAKFSFNDYKQVRQLLSLVENIGEPVVKKHIKRRLTGILYRMTDSKDYDVTDEKSRAHFEVIREHLAEISRLERKDD